MIRLNLHIKKSRYLQEKTVISMIIIITKNKLSIQENFERVALKEPVRSQEFVESF